MPTNSTAPFQRSNNPLTTFFSPYYIVCTYGTDIWQQERTDKALAGALHQCTARAKTVSNRDVFHNTPSHASISRDAGAPVYQHAEAHMYSQCQKFTDFLICNENIFMAWFSGILARSGICKRYSVCFYSLWGTNCCDIKLIRWNPCPANFWHWPFTESFCSFFSLL